VHVISERTVRALGLSPHALRALIARGERELERRVERHRAGRPRAEVAGRAVIAVDDGLATGRSAVAAVRSLRARGAARVTFAAPVGAPQSVHALEREADEVICVQTPADMWAVGLWYEDFRPTSDDEIAELLAASDARARDAPADGHGDGAAATPAGEEVVIALERGPDLAGDLSVPDRALGVVAFAHGSGSGRLSARNRAVARALNDARYATLLFDLLTNEEERSRRNVFDIELLAGRLRSASEWLLARSELAGLPLGYFGASTGAAAALTCAAELRERVGAVVSRGGRPDMARGLEAVSAPTLLIVGGADREVLALNREAQRRLSAQNELAIVPRAGHLFEEPGALEHVSRLAVGWLDRSLAPAGRR
jgi:putative phosphoribosyl transferase